MKNGHSKRRPLDKTLAKAGYWIVQGPDANSSGYRYCWMHTPTGEAGPNPESMCQAHAEADAKVHHAQQELMRMQLQNLDYRGNPVDGPKHPYRART